MTTRFQSFTSALRLAFNTIAGRPGRTALLAGAVACASALVVAVSCAITSAQATMESELSRVLGAADARVVHPFNGRFEQSWLDIVRNWPEVAHVNPQLSGSLTLIRADQKIFEESGELMRITPDAVGINFDLYGDFQRINLREGALPTNDHEIIIDPMTARWLEATPGTMLQVQRFGDPVELLVTGIYERQELGVLQRAQILMDRHVLSDVLGYQDQLSRILIILAPGVDAEGFCTLHAAELPKPLALEAAELARAGFDRRLEASRFGLIVSAIMTFLAASFIILTGLTTSVTERQREMAVIRCVGASRTQLFVSQLLVGLLFTVIGVVAGIPLGAGIAALLVWYFHDILPSGFVWSSLGISLAIAGALLAGVIGSLYPAFTASRVTPLEAMTRQAQPQRRSAIAICVALGLVFISIQIALMLLGSRDARFWSYFYLGLPCLFLGYFLLATPTLLLISRVISPVLSGVLRLPADVVTGAIKRTRFRHGFTAGALMVGISILVGNWATTTALLDGWVHKIRFADGFAVRYTALTPAEQKKIADLPFVDAVCPIGYLPLRVFGQQVFGVEGIGPPNVICFGFDPDVFFSINAVDWLEGDPTTAIPRLKQGDAIVVAERFLTARDIGLGDKLTLGMGNIQHEYEIVGVVSSVGLDIATQIFGIRSEYAEFAVSGVFMNFQTVADHYDNRDANILQVDLNESITEDEATRIVKATVPGVEFRTGRWITDSINQVATAITAVHSSVAFAALLLACIAMANVMVAAIHGRRHEYGLLRAVGAHRSMLLRLIVSEVMLLAITAGIIGSALGMHTSLVGIEFYRDLAGIKLPVVIPYLPTAVGWLLMVAMMMTAIIPAVRRLVRSQPALLLAAGRND